MEETGRQPYSRKGRERGGVSEETEHWRSPMRCDGFDYIRNDKCKPEKGFPDRRSITGTFATSPRSSGYSPLGSSPAEFSRAGQRVSYEGKEGFRKFPVPDVTQTREKSWRERPSGGVTRWRKDSYQEEDEDLGKPLEGWRRRQFHKEPINQEVTEPVSQALGRKRRMREKRRNHKERDDEGGAPVIDESALSEKELCALLQAEERIGKEGIFRLKNRSQKSPKARYSCTLCGVQLDSLPAAHKHMKEKWHKKRARDKREEVMLTEIPPPGEQQAQAVGRAIQRELLEHGLSDEDMERRLSIVLSMEEVIRSFLPDCSLRLYGSSCTKFGFKDSDVNIDIQFPSDMHQPDVLLMVFDILSKSSLYVDLEADFHAKVPVVVCKEKQSGLICKVSAGNDSAHLTTVYLTELARQEPRLYHLVVGLRRWARICHIDHPEEGGLPSYSLALMVIHFLQQRKEPVLPTYLGPWIKEFSLSKVVDFHLSGVENGHMLWDYRPTQNEGTPSDRIHKKGKSPLAFAMAHQCPATVGRLWLEMLRFYSLECDMPNCVIGVRVNGVFSRETKDWPKKRIAIEDPYAVKRNVTRTLNSQVMYEYVLHCLKTTYKYFALPVVQQSSQQTCQNEEGPNQKPNDIKPSEVESVPTDHSVIQPELKPVSLVSHTDCGQSNMEPCLVEDGVSKAFPEDSDCVVEGALFEGLTESNSETAETDCALELEENESEDVDPTNLPHFPQEQEHDTESPSDSEVAVPRGDSEDERLDREDEESGSTDDLLADLKRPSFPRSQSDDDEEEDEDEEDDDQWLPESFTTEEEQCLADVLSGEDLLSESVISPNEKEDVTLVKDGPSSISEMETFSSSGEDFVYEFNKQVFTRGKSHTIVCSLCKRDGHLKRDCPEDFKRVELDPLPRMTPKFRRVLNEVCMQCYRDFAPDEIEEKVREHIVQDLEKFVRHQFEGARLRLFGSSKNGFGFRKSDLDICMVLEGRETSKGLDCLTIIDGLARVLRKHSGLCNILPITTAKVPIVKFLHVKSGLEGDISLYNTLALHNTRLLATYAAIDPRVKYLCYVMKVFSKVCDIGDASRGSLSSYAYTLMVLFFLQRRNPPIIPVLQEIYEGQKPEVLVDGWNVYFFDNLAELPRRWPEYRNNTESVGQLWLGLLQFYTEEFDFREHVICIRRKQLLTTFMKQWTSKYIVIEDPFDLSHNLGAGLSRRMTNFIMKAFINGRRVFGTPVKVYPPEYPSEMEYFFDPEVLTEGELAPNDRCCRICGKIGHFMKDCPMRRNAKATHKQVRITFGCTDSRVKHRRDVPNHEDAAGSRRQHGDQEWVRGESREAGRRRAQEDKRCFICGSYSHIKRECPQYKGPAGSPRSDGILFSASPSTAIHVKHFRERQSSPFQEEEKQKQPKVILSPQAGSLVNRHMTQGRSSPRRSPLD